MSKMVKNNLKTIALILSVVAVSLLGSCKKSSYNQLSDEEMKWLVFKNYEHLNFTDGGSNQLNYVVTLRLKSYQKDGNNYNEFTSANFLQLNDTTAYFEEDSHGQLYIFKGSAGLQVTFTWPHFPIKNVALTSLIPSLATIGGINYSDVFILNGTGFTDLRNDVQKIWYSKSKGVLQLQDTAGNTWIRSF